MSYYWRVPRYNPEKLVHTVCRYCRRGVYIDTEGILWDVLDHYNCPMTDDELIAQAREEYNFDEVPA